MKREGGAYVRDGKKALKRVAHTKQPEAGAPAPAAKSDPEPAPDKKPAPAGPTKKE